MNNLPALVGASFTAFFGILAIVKPYLMAKIVGVFPKGPRGVSELRAVYGGWMLGLGGYAIWSQSESVFYCLGIGWAMAAFFRVISFFVDESYSLRNLRMVLYEVFFAVLFLIKI